MKLSKILKNYNPKLKIASNILLVLSLIFMILATFYAYLYKNNNKNIVNSNENIVFVLDVSKSMNTIDVKNNGQITTRLKFAKKAIQNYVLKHPNFKYGLVIFAWQAQAIVPLTNDINIFLTFLEWVNYKNLTKQWTNFSQAIQLAIERFKNVKWNKNLVLISDGGDPGDYKWLDFKFPKNIHSFVFWVWSEKWGKIFIWYDDFWEPIFETYRWNYVITKLNKENLEKLASDINWKYFDLNSVNGLDVLDKYIKAKNVSTKNKKEIKKWKDFIIKTLALLSFIFLILSVGIYYLDFNKNKWL